MKVNATAAAASAARPLPAHLYVQVLAAIVLGVAMPSSTDVTGAGFMTPATTLFIVPTAPVAGIAPILGNAS